MNCDKLGCDITFVWIHTTGLASKMTRLVTKGVSERELYWPRLTNMSLAVWVRCNGDTWTQSKNKKSFTMGLSGHCICALAANLARTLRTTSSSVFIWLAAQNRQCYELSPGSSVRFCIVAKKFREVSTVAKEKVWERRNWAGGEREPVSSKRKHSAVPWEARVKSSCSEAVTICSTISIRKRSA